MDGSILPSGNPIFQLSSSEDNSDVSGTQTKKLSSHGASRKYTPLTPVCGFSDSPEWLKIDKLQFESLSLYGRDGELSILQKSLDQISSGLIERHLMLISGESGTGKTALADSLRIPTAKLNGIFARGKFDFNNRHEPYSGIVRACVEICGQILGLKEEDTILFQRVSNLIRDGLGSELSLLTIFIPTLNEVIGHKDKDASVLLEGSLSEEAKGRFHFAFQRFMRIISGEFAVLVLALDDLQWADRSSLELLDVCLSDLWIKKFMIIGTFRSNEVDQGHILSDTIIRFRIKCQEAMFEMNNLSVVNLDVNAVNKIILVLLSMENDESTMGLAQLCFKKTQGNPFFVLQFLQMVHNSGLLKYNYGSFSWNWNTNEIVSSTSATTNVVSVLKAKLAYLPENHLKILKIAACLGSTFDEQCLRIIWEHSYTAPSSGEARDWREALMSGLKYLEQDGYIIRHSNKSSKLSRRSLLSLQTFTWTHDKIQEAVIMLIPNYEQDSFHCNAGYILLAKLDVGILESRIFVVTNLLNKGVCQVAKDEKQLMLASLNHCSSLRALSISAFESVADYARKGIMLLPHNHWNDHYELSLGLHCVAVQAEGFLGNYDLMEEYSAKVLAQNDRPMIDKTWVYRTLVNSMISKGQIEEAADLLFRILAMCKCDFPKNPLLITAGVIRTAFKTKSIMKSINPEVLPRSNNPMTLELQQLMNRLVLCLYFKKDIRLPLVIFRILDWTVKHGFSDFSSVAFALTGMLLIGVLNDVGGGTWYGEHALKLMEKSKHSPARSCTMFLVNVFVLSWTKPMAQLLRPMLKSYNEGMQSGDHDSAAYSSFFWLLMRFIAGNPLGNLEKDIHLYSKQMKDWNVKLQNDFTICLHQTVLNIVDQKAESSTKLIGEALGEEDYRLCGQDSRMFPALILFEGVLLTYFGNYVQHADITIRYGHDYLQKSYPASPSIPFDTLLKGVSCFAAARETSKAKYTKMGEKMLSKIKRWREMGNPNVIHYESFLNAESAALKNKKSDAIKYYEKAITHGARSGFLHDAAFACERLAEFHRTEMDDENEAAYRLQQSLMYWKAWGAEAKVQALEKKYCFLSPESPSSGAPQPKMECQNEIFFELPDVVLIQGTSHEVTTNK